MATKEKAKRPSRERLAQYFAWDEERLALGRQAKDIKNLQGEIEEQVLEYVRDNGGPERCTIVCGYRLSIDLKRENVDWKTEFMRVAGQEAAENLIAAAEKKEVPKIERPA
jgi:hypothetical protein